MYFVLAIHKYVIDKTTWLESLIQVLPCTQKYQERPIVVIKWYLLAYINVCVINAIRELNLNTVKSVTSASTLL